jgi:hypothetical protein
MKRRALLLAALICSGLLAQEGHPLKGTWHGSWGVNEKDRTQVTLVMDWDGKNVTGIMNPGLRSSKLENISFDPAGGWKFHFESNYKDKAGATSRVVIDCKIEDVTSPRRQLVGTFAQGEKKGDFKAARDN